MINRDQAQKELAWTGHRPMTFIVCLLILPKEAIGLLDGVLRTCCSTLT